MKVSIVRDNHNNFKADYVKIREDLDIDEHASCKVCLLLRAELLQGKMFGCNRDRHP